MKSKPSDKAMEAAKSAIHRRFEEEAAKADFTRPETVQEFWLIHEAFNAAHDPALGLDRSVCFRDVLEAIDLAPKPTGESWDLSRLLRLPQGGLL